MNESEIYDYIIEMEIATEQEQVVINNYYSHLACNILKRVKNENN